MVLWGAYTCMRPGETFAARFSRLSADEYDVGRSSTAGWVVRRRRSTAARGGSSFLSRRSGQSSTSRAASATT